MQPTSRVKSRVYYRTSPAAVVIERNGLEIAHYKSAEKLVETHIKGMLAKETQDTKHLRELLKKYQNAESTNS